MSKNLESDVSNLNGNQPLCAIIHIHLPLPPLYSSITVPSDRCLTLMIATRVGELPASEARAGDAEGGQALRLAVGAASVLVFADFQLDVIGAPATSLVFAACLVHLVRFVVAAPQADQALEAHLEGFFRERLRQLSGERTTKTLQVLRATSTARQCHHVLCNQIELFFGYPEWSPLSWKSSHQCGRWRTIGPVTQARRRLRRSGRWRWWRACSYSGERRCAETGRQRIKAIVRDD